MKAKRKGKNRKIKETNNNKTDTKRNARKEPKRTGKKIKEKKWGC